MTQWTLADIERYSFFPNADEILFSMHTTFRIEHIEDYRALDRLKRVSLRFISEEDEQLLILSDHLRHQMSDMTSTNQIAELLLKVNQPKIINKLYPTLSTNRTNYVEIFDFHYYRGLANTQEGKLVEASSHLEQAFECHSGECTDRSRTIINRLRRPWDNLCHKGRIH